MQSEKMKRCVAKLMALTMMLLSMSGLVACNRSDSGEITSKYPLTAISAVGNQNSAEAVLDGEYENIIFAEDFHVEVPKMESFHTFTMTRKPGVSAEVTYERYLAAVERYFPGVFTEEEKRKGCQVLGKDAAGNTVSGTYEQVKDKLAGDDQGIAMLLVNDRACLQIFGCGYTQTATGNAAYLLDNPEGGNVGMYVAADANTVTEKIYIPQSGAVEERVYPLIDGEVKLTDAIAYTEEFFQNGFDEGVANPELIPEVCEAWVVDMGDGIYGYHFTMTPTYHGIRFDAQPMNNAGSSSSSGVRNSKNYSNFPGYAFTIEQGKLDSIMIVGTKLAYDIKDVKTHREMISAKQAIEILSEEVSGHAGLVIERAEFLYAPYQEGETDGSLLKTDAMWRFAGRNKNDGLRYLFYVNAVTGEFDYYHYS